MNLVRSRTATWDCPFRPGISDFMTVSWLSSIQVDLLITDTSSFRCRKMGTGMKYLFIIKFMIFIPRCHNYFFLFYSFLRNRKISPISFFSHFKMTIYKNPDNLVCQDFFKGCQDFLKCCQDY